MEHIFSGLGRLYPPFNLFSSNERPACMFCLLWHRHILWGFYLSTSFSLSLPLSPFTFCLEKQVCLCCSIVSLTILLAPLHCKPLRFCAVITKCVTEPWYLRVVYTLLYFEKILYAYCMLTLINI